MISVNMASRYGIEIRVPEYDLVVLTVRTRLSMTLILKKL